jgi:hypothetical protein
MDVEMIYVIQLGRWPVFKVGFTTNADQRMSSLGCAAAMPLQRLALVEGTIEDEKRIHRALAQWNTNGEWYAATPASLAALRVLVPDVEMSIVDVDESVIDLVVRNRIAAFWDDYRDLERRTRSLQHSIENTRRLIKSLDPAPPTLFGFAAVDEAAEEAVSGAERCDTGE